MSEKKCERPKFPKRAIVTAGMPYGNKELHFGHIGGVFVHADIFARFLRDRVGEENVIFVSGTDCYGVTIEASYEQAKLKGFDGTITDYVLKNHTLQKETLSAYQISTNLFAASALGEAGAIHKDLSEKIFNKLYDSGMLKLEKTIQFYDDAKKMFLNGRQVTGRCPMQGCKSEIAYADECSLGHQYNPSELFNPKSVLSGNTPSQVAVENWFFDLPRFTNLLEKEMGNRASHPACRKGLLQVVTEFFKKPSIYVKKEVLDAVITLNLPAFTIENEDQKASCALVFETLSDRELALSILTQNGIRYRTGKTVVPFRLSGNVKWGIPIPEKCGIKDLTFWVWPESLWAPISFTKTYLGDGPDGTEWEKWWKSDESNVYQFIGEDNIYFYAIAEMGIFLALNESIKLPTIIPNHHLLYGKTKASSSGAIKPPKALELLNYYTPEQLRLHFMNASLHERSVGFEPKAVLGKKDEFDTVLYEGNLLTNIFNRLVRSCFYTAQKYNNGIYPSGAVDREIKTKADELILNYERLMSEVAFDKIFELLNVYLKDANKMWSAQSKTDNPDDIRCLMVDTFHIVRVCVTLFHPIAPAGCEKIREYLCVDERIWSWDNIFQPLDYFIHENHRFKFLEPRVDFFEKHPAQVNDKV
jgi:methionyl-tRNA synthetase